jgi:transcriptional regulator with XRE-family HTH domain
VNRAGQSAERDARALGAVLRALREERGLTQERLGFAAKVTKNYVSDVEGARRNPTIRVVSQLLRALDVTWGEFGQHLDAAGSERSR